MARERFTKQASGRNNTGRKEVKIKINRAGLNANGEQRYSLAVRFADDSHKKVSDTGYAVVEIDRDLRRVYFVPADSNDGFKLTSTKTEKKNKSITFTIHNCKEWEDVEGCYFLLKDPEEGLYYIDYSANKKGE